MSDLARHCDRRGGPVAALHTVECGEASPEGLLSRLRASPEVEFAEHSPRRKRG